MKQEYDLVIIGSGPAGFSCAMQGAKLGKKVVIIEADQNQLGGSWVNAGTLPSKALKEAAQTIQQYNRRFSTRHKVRPYDTYTMNDLLTYKDRVQTGNYLKLEEDLHNNNIDLFHGFASIVNPNTVKATTKEGKTTTFKTDYILISTGSRPAPPIGFKVDHKKVINYESVLKITHIPHRVAIIGHGEDVLEYATIFEALGSRVAILSEKKELLPWLDNEISDLLNTILEAKKIEVVKDVRDISIKENGLRNVNEVHYIAKDGSGKERKQVLEIEYALYLGDRIPNIQKLGLENVGILPGADAFIPVNKDMRTEVSNIFAAGDVIDFPRSASIAFMQGRIAACRMFGVQTEGLPDLVPYGVQSIPEIAKLGLTEQEAKEKELPYLVGRAYFQNNMQNNIRSREKGMLKIIFDKNTLKPLGIHILGVRASDLIHLGQAVMSLGADIRYFINHVLNYPTISEAYRIAALNGLNQVQTA